MKNKVIKNFIVFIIFWLLIVLGLNLHNHQPLFYNFPWEILLIFALSLIQVVSNLSKRAIWGIYFVVFYIYMLLVGGYYNWSSLVIFAISAIFMSAVTYFIGSQFKKGDSLK